MSLMQGWYLRMSSQQWGWEGGGRNLGETRGQDNEDVDVIPFSAYHNLLPIIAKALIGSPPRGKVGTPDWAHERRSKNDIEDVY